MPRWYVEVVEVRAYAATIEAVSEEEAERIALERAHAGELPQETLDREVTAVLHPLEEQHAA